MARFVYLISPKRLNNNFYIELSKVLKSKKVKYFQLRLKGQKDEYVLNILKKIKKITKKYRVKLILNDNPYLALKSNVDGCHIGQLDTNVSIARKILKKKNSWCYLP